MKLTDEQANRLITALRNARNVIQLGIANEQWGDESSDERDSAEEAQGVCNECDDVLNEVEAA